MRRTTFCYAIPTFAEERSHDGDAFHTEYGPCGVPGRRVTELLASQGYFVYAGARSKKDLDALNALENVEAVRLDVTVQDEIDAAVETVRKGGHGLYGLVNNAGVFTGGPLIETDVGELQWLFDDNSKPRYMVVPNQEEAQWTISKVISELIELNERQPYSYSREQLIEMIDAAMAVSSPAPQ
jgi:NAD(P)-dependent dehydrogenase (short-subunit alcohol dehydrogenase family)